MGVTAIKSVRNFTRMPVRVRSREDPGARGHDVLVPQNGGTLPVDMRIPWARSADEFAGHHLEVVVDEVPRFWIWQVAQRDGDWVRAAATRTWSDPGPLIPGTPDVDGERELCVLGPSTIVLRRLSWPHGVTEIVRVRNVSGRGEVVRVFNIENQGVPGHGQAVAPGGQLDVSMWIPWARSAGEFAEHHLRVDVTTSPPVSYWIWQAERGDGDWVRVSRRPAWEDPGELVRGVAEVSGRRILEVNGAHAVNLLRA